MTERERLRASCKVRGTPHTTSGEPEINFRVPSQIESSPTIVAKNEIPPLNIVRFLQNIFGQQLKRVVNKEK